MKLSSKIALFLLCALSVLCLCSCKEKREVRETLLRAEILMEEHPDSALDVLKNVDSLSLKSPKDIALYSLLRTQAEDKNYKDTTDTRIITRAVDYYSTSKDEYHKMLAYYYRARIEQNAEDYSKAIVDLMKAEKAGLEFGDNFYLGLIYRMFSEMYNSVYNMVESLKYAQKSYDFFLMSGKENYANWAMEDLCRAYHNGGDYEECEKMAEKIVKIADANQDNYLLSRGLGYLASSRLARGLHKEALVAYVWLFEECPEQLELSDYFGMGLAYLYDNQIDKAYFYKNYVENKDTTNKWLSYELFEKSGDFQKACSALKNEYEYQYKLFINARKQNVTDAVLGYKEYEQQQQNEQLAFEKKSKFLYISIMALFSILLFVILFYRVREYRRKVDDTLSFASELQHSLNSIKECNSNLQSAIDTLYGQSFKAIDELCGEYYAGNVDKNIVKKVSTIVNGFKDDKKTIQQLERFVDNYDNNIMQRFRNDFPDFREIDYKFFLYLAAGFSLRTISVFIDVELNALYSRKTRLKQRINRGYSQYKEEYIKIIDQVSD